MKILKRGLLVCIVLSLLLPIALAENGCCALTESGDTCHYTSEENCASSGEYFAANAECVDSSFCGTGVCVKPDGLCADGAGEYSCGLIEGADYYEGQTSDEISECGYVCCQYGSEFTYTTQAACEARYEAYDGEIVLHSVSDEAACIDLGRAEEKGCCVTEDLCNYVTYEECTYQDFDPDTGTGFFAGQLCSDITDDLESGGYETAETCACEPSSYSECSNGDIQWFDSCGNPEDIDDCGYPDSICSEASGVPQCVDSDCLETFEFENSGFTDFNEYRVYYQDATGESDYTTLRLGDRRTNGESWCIYESPVGDFKDRVGSQHYRAMCVNGEEVITTCGNRREKICVASVDDSGNFASDCVYNNHPDWYLGSVSASSFTGDEPPTTAEEFSSRLNKDGPLEWKDGDKTRYGVSTVPIGTYFWENEDTSCDLASFDCDVWYGDVSGDEDSDGWEAYINTFCLRPSFVKTSANFCSARGDCGDKENILGDPSASSSYQVTRSPTTVGKTKVTGDKEGLRVGIGGAGESQDYGGCFYHDNERESQADLSLFYDNIVQGQDSTTLIASNDDEKWECEFYDSQDGARYDNAKIKEDVIENKQLGNFGVISDVYSREYMTSPWLDAYTFTRRSTGFIGNKNEVDPSSLSDVCDHSGDRTAPLAYGLGTNYKESDVAFHSDVGKTVANWHQCLRGKSAISGSCSVSDSGNSNNELLMDLDKLIKDAKGKTTSSSLQKLYGNLITDPDGYVLYNYMVSLKPWYYELTALEPQAPGGTLKADRNSEPVNYLSFYKGDDTCGRDNEWKRTSNNDEGKGRGKSTVSFQCNAWDEPSSSDNNCNLCDLPRSQEGLVYDKDGVIYFGTVCNEWRCHALGNCMWLGDDGNDPVAAVYDLSKPSCVESEDCDLDAPDITAYTDNLGLEGASVTENSNGYEVENIPIYETFNFGVKTDQTTQCKFFDLDDVGGDIFAYVNEKLADGTAPDKVYDLLGTGISGNESSQSTIHTMNWHIDEGSAEKKVYVFCQNTCDLNNIDFYEIELSTSEAPDIYPPTIHYTVPDTNLQTRAATTSQEFNVYLDEPSQCRWAETEIDDYNSMENYFDSCDGAGEGSEFGFYECYEGLDLTDLSTKTVYYLCQDLSGNTQAEASSWTVSKSAELLISQTSPEGDLYYGDVTLQVQTTNGVDSGNSICSYSDGISTIDMENDATSYHEQALTLSEGSYSYQIYCEDEIGNSAETSIEFAVLVDRESSQVEAIYYLSGKLYVITNENAICQIGTESIEYGEGEEMAGSGTTDHTYSITDEEETYHVACIDEFANEMSGLEIDLRYYSN